ncbi:MAG: ATP-binding protein, partial [Pseudomonadota bacterium]
DVSMIHFIAGLLDQGRLTRARPFRAPHHSASMAAMVGGGIKARPGEASLAHHGVLFLDELPEFSSPVLDSLRQPLETGDVLIARANFHVRYPARFQLVAAMNPCKCGYGRASGNNCGRGPNCEALYQARVSGPLLDRMDLSVTLPAVAPGDLCAPPTGETSALIASRIAAARTRQTQRMAALAKDGEASSSTGTNASLPDALLAKVAIPDAPGQQLMSRATEALNLSARGYHRVLRVARTIADLDGSEAIGRQHLAEAISYRQSNQTGRPGAPALETKTAGMAKPW